MEIDQPDLRVKPINCEEESVEGLWEGFPEFFLQFELETILYGLQLE